MRFERAIIFTLSAFAVGQIAATLTLLSMPKARISSAYTEMRKPNFFYAFSQSFGAEQAKSLSAYSLKAIFTENGGGFILFYDGSKQVVLDVGKEYGGYKLASISGDKAIFNLDGRVYELVLQKSNEQEQTMSKKSVDKMFKNPAELINEIDLTQADGGLLVLKVKSGGMFDKMGLMANDTLKEVNGEKLTTLANLPTTLQNLQNASEIRLKILRNNQEKELNYAIK